jgi:hypothetical protein
MARRERPVQGWLFKAPAGIIIPADLPAGRKAIGIVGSRRRNTWRDFLIVREAFIAIYRRGDHIVSGGCEEGGDRFAEILALALVGVPIKRSWRFNASERCEQLHRLNPPLTVHPAMWRLHGRAAGFIRNTYIARDSDVLIACVAEDRTGGTEDTIEKFCREREKRGRLILV